MYLNISRIDDKITNYDYPSEIRRLCQWTQCFIALSGFHYIIKNLHIKNR